MKKEFETLTVDGVERTIGQWAKSTKILYWTIRGRVRMGWPPRQCVGYDPRPQKQTRKIPLARKELLKRIKSIEGFSGLNPCLVPVMVPDAKLVGAQVYALRKKIGFTEPSLARELKCSTSKVFLLQKGKAPWTMDLIAKVNAFIQKFVDENRQEEGQLCSEEWEDSSDDCSDLMSTTAAAMTS